MTIGNRIKQLRKEKRMTQTDITEGFLTKGMLSLIENNKSTPSMETLEHIAKKLGVSVSYLIQDGDEAWTKEMSEHFDRLGMNEIINEIQDKIEPNIEKIFPNEDGIHLLELLRNNYRLHKKNQQADQLHEVIYDRLSALGHNHLAVRELINHAISKMFAYEYEEALHTLETHTQQILDYSKHDKKIKIDYYAIASMLSSAVEDHQQFVEYAIKVESLSKEHLNFSRYYDTVRLLVLYFTFTEESEQKKKYVRALKDYLNYLPNIHQKTEFMDEDEFYYKYYLLDNNKEIEARILRYQARLDSAEKDESNVAWLETTRKQNILVLAYVRGEYHKVIKDFDLEIYSYKEATHPIDRITRQVRSLVYALSLFEVGKLDEAKNEIKRIEDELGHLTESLYAEEFRLIKEKIYKS